METGRGEHTAARLHFFMHTKGVQLNRMSQLVPMVTIQLDRERHLRVDWNALINLERASGKSVLDPTLWEKPRVKDLRRMLWAALLHEDPLLTETFVGDLVDSANMSTVMAQVTEAYRMSMTPTGGGADQGPLAEMPQVVM